MQNECESLLSGYSGDLDFDKIVQICSDLVATTRQLSTSDSTDNSDKDANDFSKFKRFGDYVDVIASVVCLIGAAFAAGLTVCVVSLNEVNLRVKLRTGTLQEQYCVKKLLPLMSIVPKHRVLVTLLLANSLFNEALPTFLDNIVPTWAAVIISVTAVLFVSEIIPSAIFTGPNKLLIASRCAGVIWVAMMVLFPLAYPISWILDRTIPEEKESMSRSEIKALVSVHREIAQEEGLVEPFNEDEEDMVIGALSLSIIRANHEEILKPLESLFMLNLNDKLDKTTRESILAQGYSRIPICLSKQNQNQIITNSIDDTSNNHSVPNYLDDRCVLLGYILVKELILLDVNDHIPVSMVKRYKPVCCSASMPLSQLLNEFQEGYHMAFVCERPDILKAALDYLIQPSSYTTTTSLVTDGSSNHDSKGILNTTLDLNDANIQAAIENVKRANIVGILTIEDVIEVLLTENVYDESDLKRNINLPLEKSALLEYKRQKKAEITHYFPPTFVKNKFEI